MGGGGGGLFGAAPGPAPGASPFGATTGGGLFGAPAPAPAPGASPFGAASTGGGLFGTTTAAAGGGVGGGFGTGLAGAGGGGLFGGAAQATPFGAQQQMQQMQQPMTAQQQQQQQLALQRRFWEHELDLIRDTYTPQSAAPSQQAPMGLFGAPAQPQQPPRVAEYKFAVRVCMCACLLVLDYRTVRLFCFFAVLKRSSKHPLCEERRSSHNIHPSTHANPPTRTCTVSRDGHVDRPAPGAASDGPQDGGGQAPVAAGEVPCWSFDHYTMVVCVRSLYLSNRRMFVFFHFTPRTHSRPNAQPTNPSHTHTHNTQAEMGKVKEHLETLGKSVKALDAQARGARDRLAQCREAQMLLTNRFLVVLQRIQVGGGCSCV
jgi:hypothetical protein